MDGKKNRAPMALLWSVAIAAVVLTLFWYVRDGLNAPEVRRTALDTSALAAYEPLDLNEATEAELDDLPGVGPVLAERIVAQREQQGPFQGPEDVLAVPGVGPETWREMEPYIAFQ